MNKKLNKFKVATKKNTDCCDIKVHPDHKNTLPNVNRVIGQIEGIKKMIQDQRYCPDILIQLRAIRSAINSIEATILEAHLDSCIKDALSFSNDKEKQKKIAELKKLYKQFN